MTVLDFPAARADAHVITFDVIGDPVAFARSRHNGRQHFMPIKQRRAMSAIQEAAIKAKGRHHIWTGVPLAMEVSACFAYPASWPKYRKVEQWKTSKPDADNLGKIVADACNGILYADDAQISVMTMAKTYGPEAKITVSFHAIQGGPQ